MQQGEQLADYYRNILTQKPTMRIMKLTTRSVKNSPAPAPFWYSSCMRHHGAKSVLKSCGIEKSSEQTTLKFVQMP